MDSQTAGYITDLAYTDNYYEPLGPVAINYLAGLNGYRPRDLDNFDYCELGCGAGLSLLVHAAAHPGGRFVGIDLNPQHIDHARQTAEAAGIANLQLIAEPVSDALAESGLPGFDFIVMHGLYSWVAEEVRAIVRRFIASRLKPGGLVLVTYNALPGSAARQTLREIMRRFALPLTSNSLERAELGLAYLRLMLNAQAPVFHLNPELTKYAHSLLERDPRYIAHEFFNEHWNPLSVDQVSAEMGSVGLEYAGCLPLWQNHPEADVPANLAEFFASQPDRVAREAHKDFIYNTVFRTDLYVRAAADGSHRPGRSAALWTMPFCSVTEPEAVNLSVTRGAIELPLNTRASRSVFGTLEHAPAAPAAFAGKGAALQELSPTQLVDAVCWWVLSGQVRPAATAGDDGAAAAAATRANRILVLRALHDADATTAWLVSPRFGCAFPFDKIQALALCALAGADGAPERALAALMRDAGLTVEEGGNSMGEDQLHQLAREVYGELEAAGVLEQARRLGIVA